VIQATLEILNQFILCERVMLSCHSAARVTGFRATELKCRIVVAEARGIDLPPLSAIETIARSTPNIFAEHSGLPTFKVSHGSYSRSTRHRTSEIG
jgi:hypothetical protein